MSMVGTLPRVVSEIEDPEVRGCATLAYHGVVGSDTSDDMSRYLLTLVSLIRFATCQLLVYDLPEARDSNPLTDEENNTDNLRDIVHRSGVYFFGPMFKGSFAVAPLRDRGEMFSSLSSAGYSVSCLAGLNDTQLDMFFTRTLETGLISNPHELLPE